MFESSRRTWLQWTLGTLALVAWVALDLVPEWYPSATRLPEGQRRLDSRLGYELRYNAGWLTAYYQQHGELPDPLPPNRAAAGNGALVLLCPARPEDLVSETSDWALCPEDGGVRGMARSADRVLGMSVPEKVELFPD
jgi:hypothetical protein